MDTLGSWEMPEALIALRWPGQRFMASEATPVEDRLPRDAA